MKAYVESLLSGLMVYWEEEKNAARYYVHLLIGDKHKYMEVVNGRQTFKYKDETFNEIALVETERNIRFFSFTNLGKIDQNEAGAVAYGRMIPTDTGKNYYVYVEAEDKNGNIIGKTEKIMGRVYAMNAGYFSQSK